VLFGVCSRDAEPYVCEREKVVTVLGMSVEQLLK
jgi:hypothetical protein